MTLRNMWFEASNYSILAHCTPRAMPWCVLDNIGHTIHPERDSDGIVEPLPGRWQRICDRHDKAIMAPWQDDECDNCGETTDCPC